MSRFLVMVKATPESEAGVLPTEKEMAPMGKFNEELIAAGMLLDAQGLERSAKGKRITFPGGKPRVIDGPFSEAKELVAGFWLLQAKSYDEVVEWIERAPFTRGESVEIRRIFEFEDFAPGTVDKKHFDNEKKQQLKNAKK